MLPKFYFAIAVFGILLISACSKKQHAPDEVAVNFYNVLFNEHDVEKASEFVTPDSREKLKNDFKFIEGALQIVQEAEPVKYIYQTDAKKSSIKNDSAFIYVWTSLDSTTMETLLLKVNDEWLVDFNYTPPVDAFNSILIDEVINEMSKFADSVTVADK